MGIGSTGGSLSYRARNSLPRGTHSRSRVSTIFFRLRTKTLPDRRKQNWNQLDTFTTPEKNGDLRTEATGIRRNPPESGKKLRRAEFAYIPGAATNPPRKYARKYDRKYAGVLSISKKAKNGAGEGGTEARGEEMFSFHPWTKEKLVLTRASGTVEVETTHESNSGFSTFCPRLSLTPVAPRNGAR